MQKSSKPQPAAALDSRQLDLPLFDEPGKSAAPPQPKSAAPLAPDGQHGADYHRAAVGHAC